MKFFQSQKIRQFPTKTRILHKGNQIWLETKNQIIFNPNTTKIQPKSFRNVTNCNQSEPTDTKINQIMPKVKQIDICEKNIKGLWKDSVRIM